MEASDPHESKRSRRVDDGPTFLSPPHMPLTSLKKTVCFGGVVERFSHESSTVGTEMKVHVFFPPQAKAAGARLPVLYWLSGLTCTDENFIQKAGAQRAAAEHGVILVCPDTSPRGAGVDGEDESWDFGTGAGFYVNATAGPWAKNYNMFDYVTKELFALVGSEIAQADNGRASIFGHSMGGMGALTCALKTAGQYKSVSAFAPICNPTKCPWGEKNFGNYLGSVEAGAAYDPTVLAASYDGPPLAILCDQGTDDSFLKDQLHPQALVDAAKGNAKLTLESRMADGYDHSYFFIATFIDEHVAFHMKHLAQ